ncbi:hypothetical protein LBMAG49_20880 [Planctomycetota bacterium]|nr:hypothetical protein LBMAG49_20880 [Planctomycetota bacterium]
MRFLTASLIATSAILSATIIAACESSPAPSDRASPRDPFANGQTVRATNAHRDSVMTSRYCAECHPDIYAEHAMNTHGRAFTDPEVRLATGNFEHGDCIRCHTPRPVFETGIGQNPQRRYTNLEEGNTCMTCHWRQGVDYASFRGGGDCKTAFDPRVGTVESCATCHRNHGTPYQWEKSPNGKAAGNQCIDCHMKEIERPIAVGGPVKKVKSHVFPGARSESQVRKAYDYQAKLIGNEVIVTITNRGAGHNFPTELKQRSLESLVVVRDEAGKEIARSRMVFRDPYKRPYGLQLLVNTQIPSGESRAHKVPIGISNGTIECELHFKHYFPIEDNHPDLARRLEATRLPFANLTPNLTAVVTEPEIKVATPEGISAREASVADLVDFARPPIGKTEIDIPKGSSPADLQQLISLFMFPVPQANRAAIDALTKIGPPAIPYLITALGSWDNKTFNASMQTLLQIGKPAVTAIRAALQHKELYVRLHARLLLQRVSVPADKAAFVDEVSGGLQAENPLDRASTCELLAAIGAINTVVRIRELLADCDPDVVRAAALALAKLGDRASAPFIETALLAANFIELRIDLAFALCQVGGTKGALVLLANLDYPDDLIRATCFENFYAVTGQHQGYDPSASSEERLAAIARLQAFWARNGGPDLLHRSFLVDPATSDQAFIQVMAMGGGAGIIPAAEDDETVITALAAHGSDALPALIKGLKFPPGFAAKRASVLTALQRIGDRQAAPFVAAALRDPVFGVAAFAAAALETCGDPECLPALRRYEDRLRSAAAAKQLPASIPSADPLLATAARTRLMLGEVQAKEDLVYLLLSDSEAARRTAIGALQQKFGEDRGFDAAAEPAMRRAAALRWL